MSLSGCKLTDSRECAFLFVFCFCQPLWWSLAQSRYLNEHLLNEGICDFLKVSASTVSTNTFLPGQGAGRLSLLGSSCQRVLHYWLRRGGITWNSCHEGLLNYSPLGLPCQNHFFEELLRHNSVQVALNDVIWLYPSLFPNILDTGHPDWPSVLGLSKAWHTGSTVDFC